MTHSTSQRHSFFHHYYYRHHHQWITFTPLTKRNGFRLYSDENNSFCQICARQVLDWNLEFFEITGVWYIFITLECCLFNKDLIVSSVFVNNWNRSNEIWWITRNHRKVHIWSNYIRFHASNAVCHHRIPPFSSSFWYASIPVNS